MRRLASETDIEAVFRIYMHETVIPYLGHDPMSMREFQAVYRELLNSGAFFIYEAPGQSGQIGGFFKVTRQEGRAAHVASLGTLAVNPTLQGHGIGRAMVKDLISMLRGLGIRRIELLAEADNIGGLCFYRSLGFEQEGVLRKAYKRAGEEDYVDEVMLAKWLEAPEPSSESSEPSAIELESDSA